METLEKIAPAPNILPIDEEALELTPIRTLELPRLLKAIKPIFPDIKELLLTYKTLDDAQLEQRILTLVLDKADVALECIIAACAIAARKPQAWVDALELDDLVRLFGKLLEVNGDFLAQKVLPAFTQMIEGMTEMVAGQKQSMPLSEQDIGSTKS
jgi:hypothetical protein